MEFRHVTGLLAFRWLQLPELGALGKRAEASTSACNKGSRRAPIQICSLKVRARMGARYARVTVGRQKKRNGPGEATQES